MADNTDTQPVDYTDAAQAAEEAQEAVNEGDYRKAGAALDDAETKLNQANTNHDPGELQAQLAKAEAQLRKVKDEAGERRVKLKEVEEQNAAFKKKVAQLFGFESDNDDPEELLKQAKHEASERARERDELQAELNRLREDAQLRQVVERAGGDTQFLVPFLKGQGLPEWGSDEWEPRVGQLVEEAMGRYQDARAVRAPRSSGNAPTPAKNTGEKPTLTPEDLQRLYAAGDYAAITEAANEGRISR